MNDRIPYWVHRVVSDIIWPAIATNFLLLLHSFPLLIPFCYLIYIGTFLFQLLPLSILILIILVHLFSKIDSSHFLMLKEVVKLIHCYLFLLKVILTCVFDHIFIITSYTCLLRFLLYRRIRLLTRLMINLQLWNLMIIIIYLLIVNFSSLLESKVVWLQSWLGLLSRGKVWFRIRWSVWI